MVHEIILMIMLTGGGDIPVDVSFIETETMASCQERAERAKAVFPAAAIVYKAHYCVTSTTNFEEFGHNPEPVGTQYFMGLTLSKAGDKLVSVEKYDALEDCVDTASMTCVVSYQDITH